MKCLSSVLISLVFLISSSFAELGTRSNVGTPSSVLDAVTGGKIGVSSIYNFIATSGQQIPVKVDFYNFTGGELSMSGIAVESENSSFILKGNSKGIYGYVRLQDKNLAYEYSTDENGRVMVEEVAVSRVFAVDDFTMLPELDPSELAKADAEYAAFVGVHRDPLPPHIGTYPDGKDLYKLQSKPGAPKAIWINIKAIMNGDTPKRMTKAELWKAWQITAAGWSIWNLNVTTDEEVVNALGRTNIGEARMFDALNSSSFSDVSAFGTSKFSHCNQYSAGGMGYGTGRIIWHELGHLCGVYDMGYSGGTYFPGFSQYKWTPVMGNVWPMDGWGPAEALCQWCKGEHATAKPKEELYQKFMQVGKYEYNPDDIPQTKPLKFTGTAVKVEDNFGLISPTGDSDGWTFQIGNTRGHAKLKINRIEVCGQMDVDATLLDGSGKEVAHDSPEAARYATIDKDLPAGSYTLMIKGGAEGTPEKGFSNYGSIGYYGIEGELTGGVTGIAPIEALRQSIHLSPINAQGILKLECPSNVKSIGVYSLDGKQVFHTQKRVTSIDLSQVAAGMYMVNITADGATITGKIVKNQ